MCSDEDAGLILTTYSSQTYACNKQGKYEEIKKNNLCFKDTKLLYPAHCSKSVAGLQRLCILFLFDL